MSKAFLELLSMQKLSEHTIWMLIKRKNKLDLNKRKSAAVVLSVLRKWLYLLWSNMSQRCVRREEINAGKAAWLVASGSHAARHCGESRGRGG